MLPIVSKRPLVILIVEDEPIIRMCAIDLLAEEGFTVIEAGHAADALIVLGARARDVNVLFTDINMPGDMDGVALAHHARANWPWIGLLITSAATPLGEKQLPLGARFAAKPYNPEHIVEHVRHLATA